jgi:dephospho-CoA kinase
MLLVALTGGIASGKSVVAARLAEHGAVVVDADQIAREVVEPGTPALERIREEFGDAVIAPDGSLDRAALGAIVFADPGRRILLNQITHPAVLELSQRRFAEAAAADPEAIVVYDVPLLFEANLERTVDEIVVVDAPVEVRRDRLRRTRGLTAPDADAMISAQMPAEEKRRRAHHVIVNDGTLEQLADTVAVLWHTLAKGSASG